MRTLIYSIAILATCIMVMRYYDKDCPKQEGCNCISPKEVLRLNEKYLNFLDSLNYSGKQKDKPRFQDSVNFFYNKIYYK